MHFTGKIDIRATALEPIVHGAGTSGNTQLLRTQDWITKDGHRVKVPMLAGNSVKHKLRACANRYALDALGAEDHTFSKAEIDLLFSGGHLSKSGSAVDLQQARELERLMPSLSLCGYSAGNTMTESKLRVTNLHVVCKENENRLPDDLREHPHLQLRAGSLRIEEFGTRHDQARTHLAQRLLTAEASAAVTARKAKTLKEPSEDGPAERGDSAQMIYNFQAIPAGTMLWGTAYYAELTELERAALASAFALAAIDKIDGAPVMTVGAKSSVGYGAIRVELRGAIRASAPSFVEDTSLLAPDDDPMARYRTHLKEHRDEILAALRKAVS